MRDLYKSEDTKRESHPARFSVFQYFFKANLRSPKVSLRDIIAIRSQQLCLEFLRMTGKPANQ